MEKSNGMTIQEKMEAMLFERGLFRSQARAIVKEIKQSETDLGLRWSDEIGSYPPAVVNILWLLVRGHALKWINKNVPQAWYRPLFEDDSETHQENPCSTS